MGDIIKFPEGGKKKGYQVEVMLDPQLLLEAAIVNMWERLGGFKLIIHEKDYLMGFLMFADICFSNMESENFKVDDQGKAYVHPEVYDDLKGLINGLRPKGDDPSNNK